MAPEKEKITTMILYVDLKCPRCYKKVRKLLYKFPQIRDQVFDVDKNNVSITVVCCDPERLRDKLCCKGGRAIQSMEIVENKPPKPQPQPPKPQPRPQYQPMPMDGYHPPQPQPYDCYEGRPVRQPRPRPQPQTQHISMDGHHPPQPQPQPQPRPNRQCYVSRFDYFSEDNPQGCSIM